jgi:peptidoglycan endopeptidase LytE
MSRTARIILAAGVALAVALPLSGGVASAAPTGGSTSGTTTTVETTIIVRDGDSLAGLAWRHGVRLSALLRANSLELTSVIFPGQTLVIPAGARITSEPAGRPAAVSSTSSTAPSGSGTEYIVVAGDALASIAWRNGVSLGALLKANSLEVTSLIMPGRRLQIPPATRPIPTSVASSGTTSSTPTAVSTPTAAKPAVAGTGYVVAAGDALASIAWRHGVSLGALLQANSIQVTSLILPGQRLQIPPATRPIPTSVASSSTTTSTPTAGSTPAAPVSKGSSLETLLSYATAQVGAPYQFFTAGPETFDCSGLVVAAFRQIGMSVPHQSRALARLGTSVDWRSEPIAAGDLVFTSALGDPALITHVGIALDSSRWVHAIGRGRTVSIGSLPTTDRIMAVQRIALP